MFFALYLTLLWSKYMYRIAGNVCGNYVLRFVVNNEVCRYLMFVVLLDAMCTDNEGGIALCVNTVVYCVVCSMPINACATYTECVSLRVSIYESLAKTQL